MEFLIFIVVCATSYWYETEVFLFFAAVYFTIRFLSKWYGPLRKMWPPQRGRISRIVLFVLPLVALIIILVILFGMASYDVVGIWVVFYLLLGYTWLYGTVGLFEKALDISGTYDAVSQDNKAALAAFTGGFLGITFIYAGANTGDGPGWWVVFIAGLLGLGVWLLLGVLFHCVTHVSEHITVERDFGTGIRFGMYLAASGLIMARASGGDWISFEATIIELGVGWPVLFLGLMAVLVEKYYHRPQQTAYDGTAAVQGSVLWGAFYLLFAAAAVIFAPAVAV